MPQRYKTDTTNETELGGLRYLLVMYLTEGKATDGNVSTIQLFRSKGSKSHVQVASRRDDAMPIRRQIMIERHGQIAPRSSMKAKSKVQSGHIWMKTDRKLG